MERRRRRERGKGRDEGHHEAGGAEAACWVLAGERWEDYRADADGDQDAYQDLAQR